MTYTSFNLVTQKKETGVYGCQTLPKNTKVTGYKKKGNPISEIPRRVLLSRHIIDFMELSASTE